MLEYFLLEYILVAVFVMFVLLTSTAFYNDHEFKYAPLDDIILTVVMSGAAAAVWPITGAVAILAGFSYLMVLAAAYVAKFIKGMLRNEG